MCLAPVSGTNMIYSMHETLSLSLAHSSGTYYHVSENLIAFFPLSLSISHSHSVYFLLLIFQMPAKWRINYAFKPFFSYRRSTTITFVNLCFLSTFILVYLIKQNLQVLEYIVYIYDSFFFWFCFFLFFLHLIFISIERDGQIEIEIEEERKRALAEKKRNRKWS